VEADGKRSKSREFRDGARDFDFNLGIWKTHVRRLLEPLAGRDEWVDYEGRSEVRRVWDGGASLFELDVQGPAGRIEGVGLRLYNPESRQWSLNWASRRTGALEPPMIGEFKDGRGEFYGPDTVNGRRVLARNRFGEITRDSSRFEQAFSDDGGITWETNWVMEFARLEDPASGV
jgi:hypothetical protein